MTVIGGNLLDQFYYDLDLKYNRLSYNLSRFLVGLVKATKEH